MTPYRDCSRPGDIVIIRHAIPVHNAQRAILTILVGAIVAVWFMAILGELFREQAGPAMATIALQYDMDIDAGRCAP